MRKLCLPCGFTESVAGYVAALKYALACSTFSLVCTGERSNMSPMVSVGVSFMVPSMTLIALSYTLSTLADLFVPLF